MRLRNSLLTMGLITSIGNSFYMNEAYAECEDPYSVQDVMKDLTMGKDALKDSEDSKLVTLGADIEKKLICLDSKLVGNGQVFDKLYRFVGYGYYYSRNKDEAKKWFRSAQEALPSFRYAVDALEDEELRQLYVSVRTQDSIEKNAIEDKSLNIPAGTKLYLNGTLVTKAEFSKDQHNYAFLVSAVGDDAQIQARYQFEEDFPSEILKDGIESDTYDASSKKVDRIRPPEKTPLMLLGGVSTILAAGLYGYTFKTNQDFEAAMTPDDLRSIQSLNNNLIITAGVVGFVGFGLGYTGVLIDSQGGIRF
jgi:hypothetical protein